MYIPRSFAFLIFLFWENFQLNFKSNAFQFVLYIVQKTHVWHQLSALTSADSKEAISLSFIDYRLELLSAQ